MNNITKRLIRLSVVLIVLLTNIKAYAQVDLYHLTKQAGYQVSQSDTPKASLVIDAESGDILWDENSQELRDPASLAKLMTVYLVFEAMQQGKFSLDTTIVASAKHQAISQLAELSNTTIVAGQSYSIHDLLLMTLVSSSNVASMMLAEKVSNGDLVVFVSQMNQKATTMGMTNTHFTDPSGATFESYVTVMSIPNELQKGLNLSTAKDLAVLAYTLLQDYPNVLEYTKQDNILVGEHTSFPEKLQATNFSIEGALYGLDGVDGLKTGSSPEAGYNYIATAKRGNFRVIEVILGASEFDNVNGKYIRHYFGNALLEYIFQQYEHKELIAAGNYVIGEVEVGVNQNVVGVGEKNVSPTFSLENNQLTIYPNYANIFGKDSHLIPITNITEQKLKQERLENEKRLKIAAIAGGVVVFILVLVGIMKKRK